MIWQLVLLMIKKFNNLHCLDLSGELGVNISRISMTITGSIFLDQDAN
jgi:hypothetical protein